MSEFEFSEAATEFAASYAVVQAMREAFETNLKDYFQELKASIQSRALPADFREYATFDKRGDVVYWRLSPDRTNGSGAVFIWIYPYRPSVVTEGSIAIGVGTKYTDARRVALVRALGTDPRFASYVAPGRGDHWWLFTLKIPAPPDSRISTPAAVIADLLVALWYIQQECPE